ncbi:hypothetical protein LOTGIDRAFT_153544 [Lottia gigantea]|uniref:Uncharacterized protein n=1 Tax=Lottia gigantea TaxID=225164 RepID=V4A7U6_LOTGI|nr:hypothetical protein LOTGIDRAFT_153544 [Lottia gigantea]ESO91110.1 hypothetical protein LOTGIDRAFT_153544 [Lottia gigantea]
MPCYTTFLEKQPLEPSSPGYERAGFTNDRHINTYCKFNMAEYIDFLKCLNAEDLKCYKNVNYPGLAMTASSIESAIIAYCYRLPEDNEMLITTNCTEAQTTLLQVLEISIPPACLNETSEQNQNGGEAQNGDNQNGGKIQTGDEDQNDQELNDAENENGAVVPDKSKAYENGGDIMGLNSGNSFRDTGRHSWGLFYLQMASAVLLCHILIL